MELFKGKTLLITGGTGSFGSALVKRMVDTQIKEIRVFSRDEKKQDDMRRRFASKKLKFYIGDVRDVNSLENVMHGVDYVFSAAALKQVPSCEFFPMEAVKTNIEGTYNTVRTAIRYGVKNVICLSTDKAVYPINAMGISKAMMERIFIAESRNSENTIVCGTRYGNVMCSRGSVIPLLIGQIQSGKPLTLTDPQMTRFLMSLDESVDLVLYAFSNGTRGDLFIQKAPAGTIGDLAIALKELFNADNPIEVIGKRHGEKQHESLLTREEFAIAQDLGNYYRIPSDNRDLNYSLYFDQGKRDLPLEEYSSSNTRRLDVAQIKEVLMKLEYVKNALNRLN